MDLTLNFGGAWSDTERNAVTREFRLLSLGNLPFYERYQRPDYLLSDYNISQGYLTLRETTGGTGAAAYDASLETRAAYVEVESQLTGTVRAGLGVRYEDATQEVQPIDLFGEGQPLPTAAPLENDYFLPAFTLTWNFADNQQLRFRSEEHTSELQSLMRKSYAVFCWKKTNAPTQRSTQNCPQALFRQCTTQHIKHKPLPP